jgi:hypothetical protein
LNNVLQKAYHAVFGIEYDVNPYLELNLEPYYKDFATLLNLNRGKQLSTDPNYILETGKAYGIDFTAKYSRGRYYLWGTYSYGNVTRDDGRQEYPTIYDRTHNVNLLGSVAFGKDKSLELSARFNFGSGFPFTRAIGFFDQIPGTDQVQTLDLLMVRLESSMKVSAIREDYLIMLVLMFQPRKPSILAITLD